MQCRGCARGARGGRRRGGAGQHRPRALARQPRRGDRRRLRRESRRPGWRHGSDRAAAPGRRCDRIDRRARSRLLRRRRTREPGARGGWLGRRQRGRRHRRGGRAGRSHDEQPCRVPGAGASPGGGPRVGVPAGRCPRGLRARRATGPRPVQHERPTVARVARHRA